MWSPDAAHAPKVAPYPFEGRARVEALVESAGSSPPERLGHILSWLDSGKLDTPVWRRIPVRGGLEVEVTADNVSCGQVRLCGPMAAAQYIADAWNALIPTAGIVDAIYKARELTAPPQSIGWTAKNQDGDETWVNPGGGKLWWLYYADRVVAAGLPPAPASILSPLGKDYVLDPRQNQHPDKCAIYGWQRTNGVATQSPETGASFIHELGYFDYSHGVRLVRRRAWLDGNEVDLAEVYQKRPQLVSYKGLPVGPIPLRQPNIKPRKETGVASVPNRIVPSAVLVGWTEPTSPAPTPKKKGGLFLGALAAFAAWLFLGRKKETSSS